MLQTICYVSNSKINLTTKELQKLFYSAKKNNLKHKISGILIHDNGNFFQIIEGSKKNIKKIYKKIAQDKRHHHVIELINQSIKQRVFKEYETEFSIIDDNEKIQKLENYLNWLKNAEMKSIDKLVKVIENFILTKNNVLHYSQS